MFSLILTSAFETLKLLTKLYTKQNRESIPIFTFLRHLSDYSRKGFLLMYFGEVSACFTLYEKDVLEPVRPRYFSRECNTPVTVDAARRRISLAYYRGEDRRYQFSSRHNQSFPSNKIGGRRFLASPKAGL